MPRAQPAGRDLPDHPVQRTVPANSVFQQAQQTAGKYVRHPVDISKVKVYRDRPLPSVTTGRGALSDYARIYDELLTQPGMSVDLTPKQAKSMISWGKKNGKKLATRVLGPDLAGVWRLK
jgi:hypothetical protein